MPEIEPLLKTRQVAEALSVSIADVQRLIRDGRLRAKCIVVRGMGTGGEGRHRAKPRYRITQQALRDYIDNLEAAHEPLPVQLIPRPERRPHRCSWGRRPKSVKVINFV